MRCLLHRILLLQLMFGCVLMSAPVGAATIADSYDGWSVDGTQGENGWYNGYYNYTNDDDQTYSVDEFQPFLNDGSDFVDYDNLNQWNGTQWIMYRDTAATAGAETGPWTRISQDGGHPNGENGAAAISVDEPEIAEHWAIRRWVSDYAGNAYVTPYLAAKNVGCGTGTTVNLYQNGELLDSLSTAIEDGVRSSILRSIAVGDVFDLALTPVGIDGDRSDPCDGSLYQLTVSDDPIVPPTPSKFADSSDDWSFTGTQGENNWYNGYYNLTQDADGVYQTADFTPFTNDAGPAGGPVEVDGNHWDGQKWDLDSAGAPGPWTELGQQNTHPNGTNSFPNDEHWTIRRFVADDLTKTTPMQLTWEMAKTNVNGGTGVTGILMVNGQAIDTATISGTDGTGVTREFYINANPGDVIDLALTPNGADGSDGSRNRLTFRTELPDGPLYNPGPKVADSQNEFSGEQGQDGWFYGYYDERADAEDGDGVYEASEFIPFLNDGSGITWDDESFDSWMDSENHWDGTKWDLLVNTANGPWTEVTATGGHPAANAQGDLSVHWAIRRWVSDEDGDFVINGLVNNGSASGDGTVGRILLDGEEIWSAVTNGDTIDIDVPVTLSAGSILDFVIDPDGSGVYDPADPTTVDLIADGNDGTTFWVTINGAPTLFIPGGGMQGDFNNDGVLDAQDIDDLTQQSALGTNPASHDLNGDSLVNEADVKVWISDLFNSWVGDANLDGEFNSGDLVAVLSSGTYEADVDSVWSTGDFNGDGRTNTSDLVTALADGGYEVGPKAAVSAVPEPGSLLLLSSALLLLVTRRRR